MASRLTTITFPGHVLKQDPVVFAGVKRSQLTRISGATERQLIMSAADLVVAHGGRHTHLCKYLSTLCEAIYSSSPAAIESALKPFIEAAGWARVLP